MLSFGLVLRVVGHGSRSYRNRIWYEDPLFNLYFFLLNFQVPVRGLSEVVPNWRISTHFACAGTNSSQNGENEKIVILNLDSTQRREACVANTAQSWPTQILNGKEQVGPAEEKGAGSDLHLKGRITLVRSTCKLDEVHYSPWQATSLLDMLCHMAGVGMVRNNGRDPFPQGDVWSIGEGPSGGCLLDWRWMSALGRMGKVPFDCTSSATNE